MKKMNKRENMSIMTKRIIMFMMFNILCISLQLCLISSTKYSKENKEFEIPTPTPQIPVRCIVMPEEMDYCKECEMKFNNHSYSSNLYCDTDYELQNEIIQCPFGWYEHFNYRMMKKFSEYSMRCTSQKVCCLYSIDLSDY
jgi:hypothetical protein